MIVSPVFVALSTRFTIYIYIPHFPEFVAIFSMIFHEQIQKWNQEPWVQPPRAAGASTPSQREAPWQLPGLPASCIANGSVHGKIMGINRDVMGIEWISNSTNHPVYNGYQPRFDQPKQWEVVAAAILIWYMDLIPNTLVYSKVSNGPTVLDCVQQSAKHSLSQVQPCSAKLLLSWMHF